MEAAWPAFRERVDATETGEEETARSCYHAITSARNKNPPKRTILLV